MAQAVGVVQLGIAQLLIEATGGNALRMRATCASNSAT
jgi:hypothetical protein